MAYLASDLFSGTWQNIVGPTASWQSDQKSTYRGFTVFVDGYGEENNGASIVYEGNNYYEWGYTFLDSDLNGKLEISEIYRGELGDENGFTFISAGIDELVGRYYCSTHTNDRASDSGTWDRNPNSYSGTFSGSDLGIFEIVVELEFTSTENNDLIMGTTNDDLINGNGGDDFLMSRSGNDTLEGGLGNDTLEGGLGNDTINGGHGTDTAVFKYNYSEYLIENDSYSTEININNALTFSVTNNNEGTDSLTGIELVQFADKTVGIDYSNPIDGYNYLLDNVKDYDGNLHANSGSVSEATKIAYKYQGSLDVNSNAKLEDIYTNKESGRWVTVRRNSSTNQVDWNDHGQGGTTRVVGIYIDPLVTSGEVEQFGPHDSQRRFQNDLEIDNLIAKTSGDYDDDDFQEVYWKTNDGTAYLRALMHADGNIQYANYQSEEQMSDYLISKGYADVISDII